MEKEKEYKIPDWDCVDDDIFFKCGKYYIHMATAGWGNDALGMIEKDTKYDIVDNLPDLTDKLIKTKHPDGDFSSFYEQSRKGFISFDKFNLASYPKNLKDLAISIPDGALVDLKNDELENLLDNLVKSGKSELTVDFNRYIV